MKKVKVYQLLIHMIMAILIFMLLYPLGMAVWGSFKSDISFLYSKWYPTLPLRIRNYAIAFPNIWKYIINTVFVAAVGTSGMIFISSLAAFAFGVMDFRFKNKIYIFIIALMMIPSVLTLVPSYMLYTNLGLRNTYAVLIIPVIFGGAVFGVFLLRSFFEGIPEDIFDSARIDGATEFTIYRKICFPLSLPIIGTLSIMQIINIWNDYLWPMITIKDDNLLTISAGLIIRFTREYTSTYHIAFAGYLISSIPLILLFVFENRYYIEGLTSSGLKL